MKKSFAQRIAAMNAMYKHPANGKFLKGLNYWKPESKIKALLEGRGVRAAAAEPRG